MARQKSLSPTYYLRRKSGRARAGWTDAHGKRCEKLLPGTFNSRESLEAFAQLQLELLTLSRPADVRKVDSTAEALLCYLEHAKSYYSHSNEFANIKLALRGVRELYANLPVSEFGPKRLAVVREKFVRDGLTRQGANKRTRLILRCYKWLAAEELISVRCISPSKRLMVCVRARRKPRKVNPPPAPCRPGRPRSAGRRCPGPPATAPGCGHGNAP